MSLIQTDPDAKRVLVVTNHQVLGKALETGLRHLVHVDHYDATQEPAASAIERYGIPDLIILTQLSRSADPARARDLALTLDGYDQVPILIICEQPALSTPRGDVVHYLEFPFALPDLQTKVTEILEDGNTNIEKESNAENAARILIVEDEFIVAADLRVMLEHLGYNVVAKLSRAEDAVAAVRHAPPDLVLMDIHLAGTMDGIQAAGIIQADAHIPVIFLTAHADRGTLARAKTMAPYGYILKPFDEHDLHTGIQVALRRIQDERAIREREQWLHAVLRSIGDGVVATDADDRIVFLNPVAERLIGRQWDQALGRKLADVFPQFADDAHAIPRDGKNHTTTRELHITTSDNREIIVDHSRSPIEDTHANGGGQILSLRDVTARVQTHQMLQHHAEELMVQNEELTAFAHTVAHDIKDPLNIIYGYSTILADGSVELDETARQESLRTIARYALRTCNIVDELLLLAQVRDADIVPEPLDMSTILMQAQQRLADMRERTATSISQNSGAWPQAMGYGPWVEEIWVNLLSNGMKYGGNPPVLKIGAQQEGDAVRFWITDNGQGIEEEDQERLFVPFTHFHHVRATGQGLGLSIVQRIVNKLGGSVGVESRKGEGSSFHFTLPARTTGDADTEDVRMNSARRDTPTPAENMVDSHGAAARTTAGTQPQEVSIAR